MDDLQLELEQVLTRAGLAETDVAHAIGRIGAIINAKPQPSAPRPNYSILSSIGLDRDALMSMIMQLAEVFESSVDYDLTKKPFWVSASGRTTVVRRGHSLDTARSLTQRADDRFADYAVLFDQRNVFKFSDYVWPGLAPEEGATEKDDTDLDGTDLPIECVRELVGFHRDGNTWWYRNWRVLTADSADAEVLLGGRQENYEKHLSVAAL